MAHTPLLIKQDGGRTDDMSVSSNIVNNLEKNNETKCQCCYALEAEIQKPKQDISSYREIIKILLEEQSITQQQQPGTDDSRREDELFHPISKGSSIKTITGTDQTEQPYTSNSNC